MRRFVSLWMILALLLSACALAAEYENVDMEAPIDATLPPPTPAPTPEPLPARTPSFSYDPSRPVIALTFDDGPGPGTARILDALEKVGGVATFFLVGNRASEYPELARRAAEMGNEIGTHSWCHDSLRKLSESDLRADLTKSMDTIEKVTGVRPEVLRPPYGNVNAEVKAVCGDLGLVVANWSIDPEDWKSRNARSVYDIIMRNACDGAIVLCHDLYASTAEAMEYVIPALVKEGYQLVTVTDLLSIHDPGWQPGQLYYGEHK